MGGTEQRSFTEPILKFLDDEIQQGRLTENQIASVAGDISVLEKRQRLTGNVRTLVERIEGRLLRGVRQVHGGNVPSVLERLEDGGNSVKNHSDS